MTDGYDVPAVLVMAWARTMYWDLMNDIRGKPHVPRFKAQWSLANRY